MVTARYNVTIITSLETFFAKYVTFADPCYSLPLALWTIGTFLFKDFDAFPYIVITSATKRSGKTRLSELLSFCCKNPRSFGAMTPAGIFHSISQDDPTIFVDEAEVLSQDGANTMRAVLNMGYRKGQSVPRLVKGELVEFPTYCPKVFILIGDVTDTLNDRSIVVRMKRAEPAERFVFEPVKAEGAILRETIIAMLADGWAAKIGEAFMGHKGLGFLTDRDEELWTPLFAIASVLCPGRLTELSAQAADIAVEKTQDAHRYINLQGQEKAAEDDEYAHRLLVDVHAVLQGHRHLATQDILAQLKELPTAPWRKFRGDGLTVRNLADMLARFGIAPAVLRLSSEKAAGSGQAVKRGYKTKDVDAAIRRHAH